MNNIFNKKTAKKVESGKNMATRRPYIWIPDVDRLGKRVGVMGVMFSAVFLAVWGVMPACPARAGAAEVA